MTFDELLKQYEANGKANPAMYAADQLARQLGYSGNATNLTGYGGSPSEATGMGTEAQYDLSPEFSKFLAQYDYTPGMQGKNPDVDIRDSSGKLVAENFRTGDHTGSMMKFMGTAIPALVAGGFGAGIGGALGYGPMAGGSGSGIGGATGVDSLAALTQAEVNAAALGPSGNLLGSYGAGAGAGGSFNAMLKNSLSNMGVTNAGAYGVDGGIGPAMSVDALSPLTSADVGSTAFAPSVTGALGSSGIPWGQIAKTAGGQLLGAGTQVYGANQAVGAMGDATNKANDLQRYVYDTNRADNMPALTARNSALEQMQSLLKDPSSLTTQPGYQFGMDQGTKALNSGAAARGQTYSGGQAKALTRYGQDYAGTKLNDSFNRLSALAGSGQAGAGQISNAGQNYGSQVGANITNQGNADAMPWIVGGNAVADGINGLTAYGQRQKWWGG